MIMKNRKRPLAPPAVLGLVLLIAIVSASCRQRPAPPPGPAEKITLAAYAGSYGFLPFIAQEQGYFAANGLEVRIDEYAYGLKAMEAMLAGKADLATAADPHAGRDRGPARHRPDPGPGLAAHGPGIGGGRDRG